MTVRNERLKMIFCLSSGCYINGILRLLISILFINISSVLVSSRHQSSGFHEQELAASKKNVISTTISHGTDIIYAIKKNLPVMKFHALVE